MGGWVEEKCPKGFQLMKNHSLQYPVLHGQSSGHFHMPFQQIHEIQSMPIVSSDHIKVKREWTLGTGHYLRPGGSGVKRLPTGRSKKKIVAYSMLGENFSTLIGRNKHVVLLIECAHIVQV